MAVPVLQPVVPVSGAPSATLPAPQVAPPLYPPGTTAPPLQPVPPLTSQPEGPWVGPQGPAGPTGPQGPAGADSTVPGPTGPQGADGATGAQGLPGPTRLSAHEEFLPANGATTISLSQAAERVLIVARSGILQSATDGHYALAGQTLTFSDSFDGTERVVVAYESSTAATSSYADSALRTYIQTIMAIIDPGAAPPPLP